jgi:hypothetical protein
VAPVQQNYSSKKELSMDDGRHIIVEGPDRAEADSFMLAQFRYSSLGIKRQIFTTSCASARGHHYANVRETTKQRLARRH